VHDPEQVYTEYIVPVEDGNASVKAAITSIGLGRLADSAGLTARQVRRVSEITTSRGPTPHRAVASAIRAHLDRIAGESSTLPADVSSYRLDELAEAHLSRVEAHARSLEEELRALVSAEGLRAAARGLSLSHATLRRYLTAGLPRRDATLSRILAALRARTPLSTSPTGERQHRSRVPRARQP
jgi:hypothetical protein